MMKTILLFLLVALSAVGQTTFNNVAVKTNLTVGSDLSVGSDVSVYALTASSAGAIAAPYSTASYAAGNYGPTSGETSFEFLNSGKNYRIRQDGNVSSVRLSVGSVAGVTGFYVKVWREVATGVFDLVSTSENLSSQLSAGSVNTLNFTPITAAVGDYISVRVTYSSASAQIFRTVSPSASGSTLYSVSNSNPSDSGFAWTSQTSAGSLAVTVESYMDNAPVFVSIGDSIMAGNAQGASLIEPTGTFSRFGDIGYLVSQATGWPYQNMGIGGNSMAQIAARISSDLIALNPRIALMEGGVNELINGTNAATVMVSWQAALDAVVAAGIRPVVIGVLPFRNSASATDSELQQRDSLNALLRVAVEAVGGIYINPDETVGSFYAGGDANNRWALSAIADSGDGLHLSRWGQVALAQQVASVLSRFVAYGNVDAASLRVGSSIEFGGGPANIDGGRVTNINQQGTSLTIKAVGASRQSTNGNGGSLILRGGDATGSGTSYVQIQAPVPGSSGTADTSYSDRIRVEGVGVLAQGQSFTVGGNAASVDTRFGLAYIGAPAGNGVDNQGLVVSHQITNAASSTAGGVYVSESVGSGVTQTALAGVRVINPSGSGSVGRFSAFWAETLSKGSVANTYFQAGGSSVSSTPYSFYSEVTNAVYFAGSHIGIGIAPQGRFGTYIRTPNIGDGIDSRALMVVNDSTNAISGVMTGIGSLLSPASGGAYSSAANINLFDGAGAGSITNFVQLWIQKPTKGLTYNSSLVIGGTSLPSSSNPLRVVDTNLCVFLGPVEAGAIVDRPFSLADQTYQGNVIADITAGATITQWQAVYMTSSSNWNLADANGASTYPARGLAVHAANSGATLGVLIRGVVRNTSWSFTAGGDIYLSTTAGGLTQTPPSTSGDRVQKIGYALTSQRIYVDFNSYLQVIP